ncbi:hypothetical protein K443DRAFT_679000 [Laccaria amethystina LaAM-08-1]|uniref:Uncharacterized protein n=1 Tax=Laccaria amethystina LaAM-08-1 TaxID=1095629 RepID=A0A0C9XGJ0_9AGAR|nr:hypothetical protein K443DRAFT_679000 [Laccaria amethystina LaAM-08-1]
MQACRTCFFLQSGVDDLNHTPGARDPQNQVRDLLIIQHLCSLQTTQAEESTPWGLAQLMVVIGLFHLQMAKLHP